MATTVVNIYHKLPYSIYGGRPRGGRNPRDVPPGEYGFLGNPFPMGKDDREESIAKFRTYFLDRVESDLPFREAVLSARDKAIACFCKPKSCHCDVIAEWLDEQPV